LSVWHVADFTKSTFPVDILAKLCAAEIVKLFGKALRAQDAKHGSKETKTCAFANNKLGAM